MNEGSNCHHLLDQKYMNCELPDVQAKFGKGRGTRDEVSNICWIIEKAREFQNLGRNWDIPVQEAHKLPKDSLTKIFYKTHYNKTV